MAIAREKPVPFGDNTLDAAPGRHGRFGEAYVLPLSGKEYFLAEEGSYFNAHNATAGTGIATAAAPTGDSDTAVFMTAYNGSSADVFAYLDYLVLLCTAAGTAGASVHFTHQLDNTNRFSSGGTALTAQNVNMDSVKAANLVVNAGAVTAATASASSRKLGHYILKAAIPAVNDYYRINFGSSQSYQTGVGANTFVNVHPVVIGPGDTWVFTLYLPSQTAASSYEIDMGWVER